MKRGIIKYLIYISAMLSWAYVTIMQMVYTDLGMPYPPVFWWVSVVAIVSFFLLLGDCVCDIMENDVPRHRSARARRRKNRCLGVVRYEAGRWICVPDDAEDEE